MDGLIADSDRRLLRVLAFLFVVVVGVAVVPVLFEFAGIDVREGVGSSTDASPDDSTESLLVLTVTGGSVDVERTSVGSVEMKVASGTRSGPVDLHNVTILWLADRSYRVTSAAGDGDGTFAIDGNTTVDDGERATLQIDLGSDDIAGADTFGERLEAGESATAIVMTGNTSVERSLSVPDPLSDPPVPL